MARRLAAVLRSRGVGTGDRVVVMMPNCPEIFCAFQAVWKLGAVILPVMPQLGEREVGYLLQDSGAKVALVAPVSRSGGRPGQARRLELRGAPQPGTGREG